MSGKHEVALVAQPEGVAVHQPVSLDQLELPRDAGVEAHEDQPAPLAPFSVVLFVGHPSADDPMAAAAHGPPFQARARVGAARVRSDRASDTVGVAAVVEVVSRPLPRLLRPCVRGLHKRGPVGPAPDHLGLQPLLLFLAGGDLLEVLAEALDVLFELSPDHEGPVLERGLVLTRDDSILVEVPEQNLPQAQRSPARAREWQGRRLEHALAPDPARMRAPVAGFEHGLREAVAEAEVLAPPELPRLLLDRLRSLADDLAQAAALELGLKRGDFAGAVWVVVGVDREQHVRLIAQRPRPCPGIAVGELARRSGVHALLEVLERSEIGTPSEPLEAGIRERHVERRVHALLALPPRVAVYVPLAGAVAWRRQEPAQERADAVHPADLAEDVVNVVHVGVAAHDVALCVARFVAHASASSRMSRSCLNRCASTTAGESCSRTAKFESVARSSSAALMRATVASSGNALTT